jgi:NitT/TauT family transport system ATP-binding protein
VDATRKIKIKLENLSKVFKNDREEKIKVLDNINLNIYDSECLSILGPTGCGKTTLLKLIAGIEDVSKGKIIKCGNGLKTPIVWQEHRLLPWRTVIDNIKLGLEFQGKSNEESKEIARKYLSLVDLEKFENYYPHQISGGMQQRVAIARALSFGHDILLLDEPFSSLDYQTKSDLQISIKKIHKKIGGTIVYVTHIIEDAIFMGDRIVVFSPAPGRIKAVLNNKKPKREIEKKIKRVWNNIS